MANAKKIIRIVGIILLVIGLFIIILFSIYKIRYRYIDLIQIIPGVFLFVIGLVFLMASRKMIYREKKIVKRRRPKGIVLLVIGSIGIVFFGSSMLFVGGGFPRMGDGVYLSNNCRSVNFCYWISSSTSLKEKIFKIPR